MDVIWPTDRMTLPSGAYYGADAFYSTSGAAVGFAQFSRVSDDDTGIGFPAANTVSLVAGGVDVLQASATTIALGTDISISFLGTGAASTVSNLGILAKLNLSILT